MNLPPPPDRWTIDIANAERLNAIASFGFTERQALSRERAAALRRLRRAPVLRVRRHRPRPEEHRLHQDARRASIRATPIATGKLHRGRMFHVHYKPLWAAVGELTTDSKPAAPGRMIERVMLLDAVLDEPACTWLGPARDKRRHFIRHLESRLDAREYPHLTFGDGPEKTVQYSRTSSRSECCRALTITPSSTCNEPVTDGLPAVPSAACAPLPCALPMDDSAAVSTSPLEGAAGLPARRARAPGRASGTRERSGSRVAFPRAETPGRTGCRAGGRALPEDVEELRRAQVQSAVSPVARRPDNTLWMAGSTTLADALDRDHGRARRVRRARVSIFSPLVDVA